MDQIPMQAATQSALAQCLGDAQFALLRDLQRNDPSQVRSSASIISVVVLWLASNRAAQRAVETVTTVLSTTVRRMFGTRRRLADTIPLGELANVDADAMHGGLVRRHVPELRRGMARSSTAERVLGECDVPRRLGGSGCVTV